MVFSFFRTEHL